MRPVLLAMITLATLQFPSFAQPPCLAVNDDATFNDGTSMGGPNLLLAIRLDVPQSTQIGRVEVFTGESSGTNSIAIWSHDSSLNQPAMLLASGSWSVNPVNSWQGANLSSPVDLNAGKTYWVVWGPQSGQQASVLPPQTTVGQQYRGSTNGGASWNGPYQSAGNHWKLRLHCSCAGFYQSYGTGCVGTTGTPTLVGAGCPIPGGSITVDVGNGPSLAPALLALGLGNGSAPITPSCLLQTLPLAIPPTSFSLGAGGAITLFGPIPPTTPTIDFYLQVLIIDPAAGPGFSSTPPLQVHIQ